MVNKKFDEWLETNNIQLMHYQKESCRKTIKSILNGDDSYFTYARRSFKNTRNSIVEKYLKESKNG